MRQIKGETNMERPSVFENSIGNDNKQAQEIVNTIFDDLLDRRGMRQEIEACDDDVLDEML